MKKFILFSFLFCLTTTLFSQSELWGTSSNGGNFGGGFIFKSDSIGNNLVVVHHFDSLNGFNPGALLAASNNKLYGLTAAGGHNSGLFDGGVFYEYDLTTSVFKVIQEFYPGSPDINGLLPAGDGFRTLTEVSPGLIYGQVRGDYTSGVIFSYNATTEVLAQELTIPTFLGGTWNTTQGNRLVGNLFLAPDGYLYGTTHLNSQCPIPNPQFGSIIRINPTTHAYSVKYLCPCTAGNGYLLENHFAMYDDKLYSVAKAGGANYSGVIYSFDPVTNVYVNEHNFEGDTFGFNPSAMVKMPNGKFYGTSDGGTPEPFFPYGCGMLYEFDPATSQFTKKLDFSYDSGWIMNVGPFPFSLIDGTNGKLYGINANGIFQYDPALNEKTPAGRLPYDMGWYGAATPSLTYVCRKPSFASSNDTTLHACSGNNLIFDLQSDNSTTYSWTQNGTVIPSQTTGMLTLTNILPENAGLWICEMTNACGTSFGPAIDVVVTMVPAEPVITQVGPELHASVSPNYQWIDCNNGNAPISGETNQVFAPAVNGNYAVITTNGMCADTSACFTLMDLGLYHNVDSKELVLFPNPATNQVQFTTTEPIESVTVMNANGQVVLRGSSSTMDISALAPGSYFVLLRTSSGSSHGKFVKAAR